MPLSPELAAAKASAKGDLPYLLTVLGIPGNRPSSFNSPCPLCKGDTCLQYGPDDKNSNEYYWHCNKCNTGGDIFTALEKVDGKTWKDCCAIIRQRYGSPNGRKYEPPRPSLNGHVPVVEEVKYSGPKVEPVLDMERTQAFVDKHHEFLMRNPNIITHYKRGISLEVIKKYKIGFIENEHLKFTPIQRMGVMILAAWVLPITDQFDTIKGVRLHHEIKPERSGKVISAPFGTMPPYQEKTETKPEVKSVHAYYGFWPHPETLRRADPVEFSMDPAWWIGRIPSALRAKFEAEVTRSKATISPDVNKQPENFEARDVYAAQVHAFGIMNKELMAAILKTKPTSGAADYSNYTFICPGELKALACESAGYMSTAPTGGEAWVPGPEWFNKFSGKNLCLFYDDDPPKKIELEIKRGDEVEKKDRIICSGLEWAKRYATLLMKHGAARVIAKCGGRRDV